MHRLFVVYACALASLALGTFTDAFRYSHRLMGNIEPPEVSPMLSLTIITSHAAGVAAEGSLERVMAPAPESDVAVGSLAAFAALDQDSNGVVTPSELLALAEERGVTLTDEQVRQFFAALDADRSGSFDLGEWLDSLAEAVDGIVIESCEGIQQVLDRLRL